MGKDKDVKDFLEIMTQAFYGNRVVTEIYEEEIDGFILGNVDGSIGTKDKIDRTIINIPNTDNLVIIYNKYQEEERLKNKEEYFKEDGYVLKPLASIPELELDIYSRCIALKMDEEGKFESLKGENAKKILKYFAK